MKLGERTIHNAVFNTASSFIPLALSLLLWPFIVGRLGEAAYGVYALVGTVIGYFALLDLGLGNAVVKYVAEYNGRGDAARTRAVIGVALGIFLVLGLAGLVMILALARVLATTLLKIPADLVEPAYISFCAASVGFFFTMLVNLYNSIVNGLNRYDLTSIVNAVMGAATTLGTALVLYLGFGLVHVVILNVLIPMAILLVYVVLLRRLAPALRARPAWDRPAMKKVLGFGMFSLLSRVTDVIGRQVSLLIIGALLGVSAVTYYVIPFTILNRLTSLIGRIGMVIFPAVSELQGQNRHEVIEDLYLTASRVIALLATACCLPVFMFGTRFLELWMNPGFAAEGGIVLHIITLAVYMDLFTNIPTFVVDGLGHPKVTGMAAFSHALIFLSLIVPLALWMGVAGVALAFLASAAVIAPFFVIYTHRHILRIPLARLLKESYLKPMAAGAIVAAALKFIPQSRIGGLPALMAWMGGSVGAYFLVALLIGAFRAHEREVLLSYGRVLVQRFRRPRLLSARRPGLGGIRAATEHVSSRLHGCALILLYHRVSRLDNDPQKLCVHPDRFAGHLRALRELGLEPVRLSNLPAHMKTRRRSDPPAAAVTFDDGYADNLVEAKPLLDQHEIPATVFVTTGFLDSGKECWWDELERLLFSSGAKPVELAVQLHGNHHRWPTPAVAVARTWDVHQPADHPLQQAYLDLASLIKPLRPLDRVNVLDQVRGWAGMEPGIRPSHRGMTPEEIRSLLSSGTIEIGAHTVHHPMLSSLDPSEQLREITESKKTLELIIGREVVAFAYPYGRVEDYTADTIRLVHEAGFRCACSNFPGRVTRRTDPFQYPRFVVGNWQVEEFKQRILHFLAG